MLRASIAMPTFNRREILLQTLASLQRQSVSPSRYEVIVCVDGSTDGTVEALAMVRPPYSLRWVVQRNRGAVFAANAAARLARNDVVIILGDDQLASFDLVAAHLEAHQRLGTILVQGDYPLAPGHDREGASMLYERSRRAAMEQAVAGGSVFWHMWGGNFSIRRATWEAIGGFDETFADYGADDTDLGMRVAAQGIPFVFEPRALTYHQHRVNRRRYGQQAFSAGRAAVRTARKHGVRLEDFRGAVLRRPIERWVQRGWQWIPAAMRGIGGLLTFMLGVADALRVRPLQLTAARLVRRFYSVGGVATELSR